ncbi:Epidermal growth factor receptor [Armadillidium vulgare]|nr:Epidermal growth factor receptor [Armadillidium vulgare]
MIDRFFVCIGTNGRMSVPSNRDHHYRNLRDRYINCTYVDGNLELTWLQDENLDLSFLNNIREVTGYVLISHVDVKRVVLPRLSDHQGANPFQVVCSRRKLCLPHILQGSVSLFNNYNLCHVRSINWTEIMSDPSAKYFYTYNFTQPQRTCHCHESCERGCWGEGTENCQHFSKITCSPQCHDGRCYGTGPRDCCHLFCAVCAYCHEECEGGCYGSDSSHCVRCKNVKDGPYCVATCPSSKYNNNGECEDCHANCIEGCKGPDNNVGEHGCNSCKKALVNDKNDVEYCLQENEQCPYGYFSEWVVHKPSGLLKSMAGNTVCRKCHPRCKNCTAYGVHISVCHECVRYRREENCEEKCPKDHYANEDRHECLKCSSECSDGCHGPLSSDCNACRNYRIYLKGKPSVNNTNFNCTATCPPDYPYKLFREDFSDPYCAKDQLTSLAFSHSTESPQNRQNMQREKKFAHCDSANTSSPSQRGRHSSGGSRFCQDQLRILDSEMGDDDCFEPEGTSQHSSVNRIGGVGGFYDDNTSKLSSRYGWVGDMRLDLPLDEDDYLMPSPQTPGLPTVGPSHHQQQYMELMTETDGKPRHGNRHRDNYYPNGCVNGPSTTSNWVGMDNPEYHLMNNGRARTHPHFQARAHDNHMYTGGARIHVPNQQQHTVGVPVLNPNRFQTCSTSSSGSSSNGGGSHHSHTSHPTQLPPLSQGYPSPTTPQGPEDTPHEYYNEIPNMPPCTPRSETTV